MLATACHFLQLFYVLFSFLWQIEFNFRTLKNRKRRLHRKCINISKLWIILLVILVCSRLCCYFGSPLPNPQQNKLMPLKGLRCTTSYLNLINASPTDQSRAFVSPEPARHRSELSVTPGQCQSFNRK